MEWTWHCYGCRLWHWRCHHRLPSTRITSELYQISRNGYFRVDDSVCQGDVSTFVARQFRTSWHQWGRWFQVFELFWSRYVVLLSALGAESEVSGFLLYCFVIFFLEWQITVDWDVCIALKFFNTWMTFRGFWFNFLKYFMSHETKIKFSKSLNEF